MDHSPGLDGPTARRALEKVLRPLNIWFALTMSILGSCMFMAGLFGGGVKWLDHTTIPNSTGLMFTGIIAFMFFFPWFLCFYFSRILMRAIRDLEQKVKNLKM